MAGRLKQPEQEELDKLVTQAQKWMAGFTKKVAARVPDRTARRMVHLKKLES
jgi:hypothetical protein